MNTNSRPLPNIGQTLPLTYADLLCLDDMTTTAQETTSDLQTLAQDVYHLLIEMPGSNIDDPDRGVGVEGLLSAPANDLVTVAQNVESQLLKDDRINAVTATVSIVMAGGTWPDGTLAPEGGYVLAISIESNVGPLGLVYTFTPTQGLVPVNT